MAPDNLSGAFTFVKTTSVSTAKTEVYDQLMKTHQARGWDTL